MAITKLTVENFKSFDKLEVELRPFNIVVGSNASGKSNFLDILWFLRDIANDSLENAIGIRGGPQSLRNFNLHKNQLLQIRAETDDVHRHRVRMRMFQAIGAVGMKRHRTNYELAIRFNESDAGFEVDTDRMTEHFNLSELEFADSQDGTEGHKWISHYAMVSLRIPEAYFVEQQDLGTGRVLSQREGDLIQCSVDLPEDAPLSEHEVSICPGNRMVLRHSQEVMLERFYRAALLPGAARSLSDISAYDFDPRSAQQAVPPTRSRELDANAENLAVVLREILRRPESKKRLINLVSALLPFVHDLGVEEYGFGRLTATLTERFSDEGHPLSAAFASDGTIACLALVVALYFQEQAVAVFEEPDRHIHPHLASRVMQMMNEVTERTQVIVTTHNAELLRHANLEDILLVTRNSDGHSQITRPADSEVLGHFLQNELGVEDLFVQNLLDL